MDYNPQVGDAYLVTKERYHMDRIMTICAVTQYKVYWHLEHHASKTMVNVDGVSVNYHDAIDIQYFNRFANNAGLVKGKTNKPSWEI